MVEVLMPRRLLPSERAVFTPLMRFLSFYCGVLPQCMLLGAWLDGVKWLPHFKKTRSPKSKNYKF